MRSDATVQPNSHGPRKGMRKGTRSCYECRKQKVRCVFTKDPLVCENCVARGKRCTQQRRELLQAAALDTRESLRDRVAKLEAIVHNSSSDSSTASLGNVSSNLERVSTATQGDGVSTELSSPVMVSSPPASRTSPNASVLIAQDSPQNIDPIVTLFDNAIVSPIVLLLTLSN